MVLRKKDRVGDFVINRLISESGCACVYDAYHENDSNKRVVLKIAHSDGIFRNKKKRQSKDNHQDVTRNREIFYELIQNEAEHLQKLHHPGVVKIHPMIPWDDPNKTVYAAKAIDHPEQPWYLVMEYLPYKSLADYMSKITREFPVQWRLELFYQLLIMVDYIHHKGVAHCDLKPDNIFLRYEPRKDEIPSLVLIDFGTSSKADYLTTEASASLPYASPEALALMYGKGIFDRSQMRIYPDLMDVWSLGIILFELMTGEKIIPDRNDKKDTITNIMHSDLRAISEVTPNLPDVERLDRYQQIMLQKDPNRRPPVHDLIEALDHRIAPPPRIVSVASSGGLFSR